MGEFAKLTKWFFLIREDQADEYRDLKKDLEQTAKNCRILQFKLRKAERRMEQLETEKHELETQNQEIRNGSSSVAGATPGKGLDRITQLEQELNQTRDQLVQSQREVQKLQSQIRAASKDVTSTGPVLSKSRSLEVKFSKRSYNRVIFINSVFLVTGNKR